MFVRLTLFFLVRLTKFCLCKSCIIFSLCQRGIIIPLQNKCFWRYSITCIQRRLKGSNKSGLVQQMVFKCRFYLVDLRRGVIPVINIYLLSLPVAHLSDPPKRRLVLTGDRVRIQDETTESSNWFFNVLGVQHCHTGPRFKVSSEKQLITVNWLTSRGIEPTTSSFQV